ncbi:MAG: hypothetical protein KGZ39_00540 [Simkania sp.]|nr:hypothetical protein [Simkania sp.]
MLGIMLLACTNVLHMPTEEAFEKIVTGDMVHIMEYQKSVDVVLVQDFPNQGEIQSPIINSHLEGSHVPLRFSIESHKTCKFCGSQYILRCRNEECPANKKKKQGKLPGLEQLQSRVGAMSL